MNAIIVTVSGRDWYGGHNVKVNGIQVAHRPYDGAHSDTVELEIAEAVGALTRDKTGWAKEAPEDEEDE